MPDAGEVHRFAIRASWRGDARGAGTAELGRGAVSIPIAGATSLGGAGTGANPEELLLAALGACFVNTWAIFVQKLNLEQAELHARVTGELGEDPAGGFRMERAVIHAGVPRALLSSSRPTVEKALGLAEKYCILSKLVRASMDLRVEIEEA